MTSHRRVLQALALISAALLPSRLPGQTGWQTNGANIYAPAGSNVGIGTPGPAQKLSVFGSSGVPGLGSNNAGLAWFGEGPGGNAINIGYYYVPGQTPYGWIQSQFVGGVAAYYPLALNPLGGNVGIGTTSPQYKLAVNGTLGAKEVIVTNTGWADYVFKPNYRLRPLNEVAAYIREHHRLPGIPSEKEVQEEGVSLGDMQAKLLAKIEELTLHLIQLQQRIDELESQGRAGAKEPLKNDLLNGKRTTDAKK